MNLLKHNEGAQLTMHYIHPLHATCSIPVLVLPTVDFVHLYNSLPCKGMSACTLLKTTFEWRILVLCNLKIALKQSWNFLAFPRLFHGERLQQQLSVQVCRHVGESDKWLEIGWR